MFSPARQENLQRVSALELVLQFKLDVALGRPCADDLSEVGVCDPVVGIAVAGDIEEVEEVSAEGERVLLVDGEVFLECPIDIEEPGRAQATSPRRSEVAG